MPVIHPNPPRHSPNPSVIPATPTSFPQRLRHSRGRGNPEKNKTPHPSPSPHPNVLSRPRGGSRTALTSPPSLREGGRERSEQGDARNSPQYPRHVIPADAGTQRKTKHAIPNTPPQKAESSACFPICTPIQNKALYQHIYGTSQLYFPLSLDRYPDVVLAFYLYKLVSDRRIWTPIKPRFDEGIKELR